MSLVLTTRDEQTPAVALLTMNKAESMNSYNMELHNALLESIQAADADPSVRVIVVTGAGRAFCAGADISAGFGGANLDSGMGVAPVDGIHRDAGGILNLAIFECDTPIIAAINGAAVGIGATMTLAMDLRIASKKSKFAFPFARRGIVFDGAASFFLPKLVGYSKANEWILKGNIMMADELLAGGLLSEVCEPEDVLTRSLEVARDIAVNCSPTSVANNKRLLRDSMLGKAPFDLHMMESEMLAASYHAHDCIEGVQSFLEKRAPKFKDRQD
ncbi:MAG: enoyl-CoA hydratase-related protein [Hellea sp.]